MNENQRVEADSISRAPTFCPAVNLSNLAAATLKLEPVRKEFLYYLCQRMQV